MTSHTHNTPSEIVFLASTTAHDPCVFRYDHGPMKLKAPRRRGRPLGSTKNPKSKESQIRSNGGGDDAYHFINMASSNSSSACISAETRKTIRKQAATSNKYAQQRKRDMIKKRDTSGVILMRQIGGVDPFDAFTIKLEPYMLHLLKYYMTTVWKSYYTIESHTSLNPMADYWIPLAFYDKALLHLLIGCADSHASRTGNPFECPVYLKHMSRALAIVNNRIETLQEVTDETIAVVATLAFVEKTRGSLDNWRIHMEGLKRLVDLRGGLDTLQSKPMVLNKVFRADLCGSIDTKQIPFFSRHYSPSPHHLQISANNTPRNDISVTGFKALTRVLPLDSRLPHCITSLHEATHLITSLLQNDPKSNKSNYSEAAKIRFLITKTQYTLLSIQPSHHNDNHSEHPAAHELCRLVLLLYSESMLNESPPRLPICDLLVETFRDHLRNDYSTNDEENDGGKCSMMLPLDFKLWTLFVAASTISATNEVLMAWYVRAIADTARILGVDSWDALIVVFGAFLWDEGMHGRRYLEIWNDAQVLATDCNVLG